ncbi:hypothetical protein GCM10023189_60650 [Nibrella saemangeumensis]|uniref:Aspartyl protease n=2 Tax=Nibrella saemangeumensis TaxID=1084526 RepID=A0ABP8NQ25_9BACT
MALLFFAPFHLHAQPLPGIPLTVTNSGHLEIEATVGGVKGKFLLDTGAGMHVFSKSFFDKIASGTSFAGRYTGFRASGEPLWGQHYHIPEVVIGPVKETGAVGGYTTALDGMGIDGIISLTAFRNQPFTLDYASKQVVFETAASLSQRAKTGKTWPVTIRSDRDKILEIFANVQVNDTTVLETLLDTGGGHYVRVDARLMPNLGVSKSDETVRKNQRESPFTKGFTETAYITPVNVSFRPAGITDVALVSPRVIFGEPLIYDAVMGLNWLGKQVTIDVPGKRIVIQR